MLSILQTRPSVSAFQRLNQTISASFDTLKALIRDSSAEIARRRLGAYVALKAGRQPRTFEAGTRVKHVDQKGLVQAEGRVLDQNRHGVLVEFPHGGPLLLAPASLTVLGKSTPARRAAASQRKIGMPSRFRRQLA